MELEKTTISEDIVGICRTCARTEGPSSVYTQCSASNPNLTRCKAIDEQLAKPYYAPRELRAK